MDKWSNAAMARLVELQSAEEPVGGIQVFSAAPRQIPLANMKVTTKISIDLTRPNIGTRVDAMQGDGNTRYVEALLLSGGRPWEPPDGVEIAVVYNKPDGTRGMYNKLPDGTPAVTAEGNVVTIILAPQMLTVPGIVRVGIVINNDSLDQLTTFPFDLSVARNQFAGAQISEDYIRLEWLETKLDEYLQKVADSGAFKGDPFTYEDFTPAQLAALQGPAGKSAYQYAVEGGYTGTEAEFSAQVAYDSRKQIELIKDTMIRLHEGVNNDASGTVIAMSDASDGPLQGLRIFGRTTQDGTPTPDAPVPLENVGDVTVTVAGKNLLNAELLMYNYGLSTADGTVYDVTSGNYYATMAYIPVNLKGQLAFSPKVTHAFYDANKKFITGSGNSVDDIPENAAYFRLDVHKDYKDTAQVEYGSVATEYEPYKEMQTLPISTPNGLPGIPVTSGGNYTDADGQQWICDEVDLARGIYVKRVTKVMFDGSGNIALNSNTQYPSTNVRFDLVRNDVLNIAKLKGTPQPILSNYSVAARNFNSTGVWLNDEHDYFEGRISIPSSIASTVEEFSQLLANTPIVFIVPLAIPIETPIPADELAAYAALHTNKPNTTIYNDAGSHMDVEYVADTKLYIDQKINELATAIVSST